MNANRGAKRDIVSKGEEFVKAFLVENGELTLQELAEKTGKSLPATMRMLTVLTEKGEVERKGNGKGVTYKMR